MPKAAKFVLDKKAISNIVKAAAAGEKVYAKPFAGSQGKEAARILRFGRKGIKETFANSTEYRQKSSIPWAPVIPFGNRAGGKKPMAGGPYERAWLGGAGSITRIEDKLLEVGVERSQFPQVKIHQGSVAVATVKAKQPTSKAIVKGGKKDWKMRYFLGIVYGVWMTSEKVRKIGMKIPRRRVSVSADVRKQIAEYLKSVFGKSFRLSVGVQGPSPRTPPAGSV